jgi:hypothetical protein
VRHSDDQSTHTAVAGKLTLGSLISPEKLFALVVVPELASAPANLPGVRLPPITPYEGLVFPFIPGLPRPELGCEPGVGRRSPAG